MFVDLQKLSAFAGSSVFAPPQVGCSLFRLGKEFLENISGASLSVIFLRHEIEKKLRDLRGLDGMAGTGLEYMEQELSFGERSINVGINGCLMLGMIIPL